MRPMVLVICLITTIPATLRAGDTESASRIDELVGFLAVDDAGVRIHAAEELTELGPLARPAVKSLIHLLADERTAPQRAFPVPVCYYAAEALVAIGSEAVEPLRTALAILQPAPMK